MTQLFGTNGIRGIVNEYMTIDLASRIGKAWGTYLSKTNSNPHVAIGTDARLSNDMLKQSVIAGLLATGCRVTDIGLLPTPAVQYMVKINDFDSGVVITASHNPPEFNGIKGIAADGTEFSKPTEEAIEDLYFSQQFSLKNWDQIHRVVRREDAVDWYKQAILKGVNYDVIRKHQFHVVLDCGNGAGSVVTPDLLKRLGCRVTCLFCTPDGHFPGHPSEPIPENLTELMKTVRQTKADFGVAQDGDADRAIFIDEQGTYIWGDQILTLMADYITSTHHGGTVVTPVNSSTSVDEVVNKNGGTVIRTKIGSPTVAREMIKQQAVFGGEENGGLIFPELQFCRDSAMTIVKMLELLVQKQQDLSSLLNQLPQYEVTKTKISCAHNLKQAVLQDVINHVKTDEHIIDTDITDGIKVYYSSGWVLIRPSGTEPLFRVYSEAKTIEGATKLAEGFIPIVKRIIKEKNY